MRKNDLIPKRLVLSDWAAGVENFGSDPFDIATDLMMHALLYDQIYLQDEAIVLSRKLAKAFVQPQASGSEDAHRILRQIFESGAIHVFTIASWPEDLGEVASKRPIYARALYVQRFGARVGSKQFTPSPAQWKFYDALDSILHRRRRLVRPAKNPATLIPLFHATTKEILGHGRYDGWIKATAGRIPPLMRDDFVSFIDSPERGIRRLRDAGMMPRVVGAKDREPIFLRALGYQLGGLYARPHARAMERILQSTFNAAFCDVQDAAGRFGKGLAEVVTWDGDEDDDEGPVKIERLIEVPVPVPGYFDNFGEAIADVRQLACVASLRAIANDPGSTEANTAAAWKAVAEELARRVAPGSTTNIVTAIVAFAKEFVKGIISKGGAAALIGSAARPEQILLESSLASFVQGVYQGGALIPKMLRRGYREERLLRVLLHAFHTRCSRVEIARPTIQAKLPWPPESLPGQNTSEKKRD